MQTQRSGGARVDLSLVVPGARGAVVLLVLCLVACAGAHAHSQRLLADRCPPVSCRTLSLACGSLVTMPDASQSSGRSSPDGRAAPIVFGGLLSAARRRRKLAGFRGAASRRHTARTRRTRTWSLWEQAPLALMLLDCSAFRNRAREWLELSGGDLAGYLCSHPDIVAEAARSVRLLHANTACRRLFRILDEAALAASIAPISPENVGRTHAECLAAICLASPSVSVTAQSLRDGSVCSVELSFWHDGEDWSRVMVSAVDSSPRAAAERELARLDREVDVVLTSALRFSGTTDMASVSRALWAGVSDALPCDGMVVVSYGGESGRIQYQCAFYQGEDLDVGALASRRPDDDCRGVLITAIRTGQPAVRELPADWCPIATVTADGAGNRYPSVLLPLSQLAVPMNLAGRPAGALQIVTSVPHAYGPAAARVLTALAAQAAVAAESTSRYAAMAAELAARGAAEEKYRALLDGARDAVFVHDLDDDGETGRFTEVNAAACRLLGYSRDELLALAPDDVSVLDKSVRRDIVRRLLRDGTALFQDVHHTKDGRRIPVELSASRAIVAGKPTIVTVVRDTSERERDREALQQALEEVSALFRASPAAIIVLDTDGTVRNWNPAAERIFGWTAAEVVGKEYPLAPGALRPLYRESLRRVLAGEWVASEEIRRVRRDGAPIDLSMSLAPIFGLSGEPVASVGVFIDVTERKRLEEQLRQSQKMETLGRLAGGIAHDFNNLLTAIAGYGEFVRAELPAGSEAQEDMAEVMQAVQRASLLTNQLLTFSRQQVIEPRSLDLGALVFNMDRLLRRLIGEHIELITLAPSELWPVRADPGSMEQVLVNLVVNARDAMPDGGRLTIELRNTVLPADVGRLVDGSPSGECVTLTVTDTGVGMAPEVLQHAFEPFYTTKDVGRGTGLGLATVYGIVKQHSGDVKVESELGVGSAFCVILPRAADAPDGAEAVATRDEMPRGHGLVLVAEDEPMVRSVTSRMLRDAGYSVLEAGTGDEALGLVADWRDELQLVVTDVVMPQMSGTELARRIAASGLNVGVLFVSGYTDNAESFLVPGLRALGFLQKPFTARALASKVRALIDARGETDEERARHGWGDGRL